MKNYKVLLWNFSFLLSSSALSSIGGSPSHEAAVVKIGSFCSGAFINSNKVLTSNECARLASQQGGQIVDGVGNTYNMERVFTRSVRLSNGSILEKGSPTDLGVIKTIQQTQVGYLAVESNFSKGLQVLDEAAARFRPDYEALTIVGYGPSELSGFSGTQNSQAVNFRYFIDSLSNESVFGSRFIRFCGQDQGAPILDESKKIVSVVARPLFTDLFCGTHEGWVVSNLFSENSRQFVAKHAGNSPSDGGNSGGGDEEILYDSKSESEEIEVCRWFCSHRGSWQSQTFNTSEELSSFVIKIAFKERWGNTKVTIRDQVFEIQEPDDVNPHQINIDSREFLDTSFWYAGPWNIKVETDKNLTMESIVFEIVDR